MTKRISALLLSLVLCFAMFGTAFAAETATGKIEAKAGGDTAVVTLSGLQPSHKYVMSNLLVREPGKTEESDFKIVWPGAITTKADESTGYIFKKTFRASDVDNEALDLFPLKAGTTLRFQVADVTFTGDNASNGMVEYTIPEDKAEYTITFTNGGTGSGAVTNKADGKAIADKAEIAVEEGESLQFTAVPAGDSELTSVTLDGKALTADEGVYTVTPEADAKVVVTFDKKAVIPPEAETVQVTLDANGGKIDGKDSIVKTVEKGKAIGALPDAARSGYRFLGWYTEEDGGTEITSRSTFDADATIYAQWKERDSGRPSGGGGSSGPTSTTPRVKDTDPSGEAGLIPEAIPSFTDVDPSFWAYKEISWAAGKGIMQGYGNGVFSPDRMVTRQQLWMVLGRLNGTYPANMAEARTWAVANGVSDGSNPTNTMTRQQMITMLYRYAQLKGYAVTGGKSISGFPDAGSVASYAREAMAWGVGNGIVGGTSAGLLNPTGTASRAHFAVFLYRFCSHYGIA